MVLHVITSLLSSAFKPSLEGKDVELSFFFQSHGIKLVTQVFIESRC